MSRKPGTCIVKHGTYPIGGTVDGVDQMAHHKNPSAEIPFKKTVTITGEKVARVTTYGEASGSFRDVEVAVVAIVTKPGWYMKSGFLPWS